MKTLFILILLSVSLSEAQIKSFKPEFEKPIPLTEDQAYFEIIQAYQKDKIRTLKKLTTSFEKKFPQSLYLDNALYLLGQLQYNNNQHGPALKTFDKIIQNFPKASKRASALLGKSIVYQKMKLYDLAERTLVLIPKLYPGSREAQRVNLEKEIFKKEINSIK